MRDLIKQAIINAVENSEILFNKEEAFRINVLNEINKNKELLAIPEFSYKFNNTKFKKSIDIYVFKNGSDYAAIELKYRGKNTKYPKEAKHKTLSHYFFRYERDKKICTYYNEQFLYRFDLQNQDRKEYEDDIARMKEVKEKMKIKTYAVILTNDDKYLEKYCDNRCPIENNPVFDGFSLIIICTKK